MHGMEKMEKCFCHFLKTLKMRDIADLVLEDVEYKKALKIVIGLL